MGSSRKQGHLRVLHRCVEAALGQVYTCHATECASKGP